MLIPRVAALYVEPRGVYYDLAGVEPWGLPDRDAREYAGPFPVVAHPPCERWGKYATGGPAAPGTRKRGDDGGCFASALAAVRAWGGVLEHPQGSSAWAAHGLTHPPRKGGWAPAGDGLGWTCCVEQGHYGHLAAKATWLYAVACDLPELLWGRAPETWRDDATRSPRWRARAERDGVCVLLSRSQRAATPMAFRDVLIAMARTVARKLWGKAFWSPSYCAVSCGGAPLATVKAYVKAQQGEPPPSDGAASSPTSAAAKGRGIRGSSTGSKNR